MAIRTIISSLNEGDDLTADEYLIFKLYGGTDGYTSPILTTGNSINDPDVTISNGEVLITKEIGEEYRFKISAVDEQGNEGSLSNEYIVFFEILSNGVTVRYNGNTPGESGIAVGDVSGKVYTAVDNTMLNALDPLTDDYTTVCTTLCTDMNRLFEDTSFNQNINNWDVSNVTRMDFMFRNTPFNQPLNNWDVSNVTNMEYILRNSDFNQPLNNWDVSNVTSIRYAFADCPFNQNINNWNVSSVTNMAGVFIRNSDFNQPLNNWDVSNVIKMSLMFYGTNFNQPLNNWNVFNVISMNEMFSSDAGINTPFNQDISVWNVSNVVNMFEMFFRANNFNQDLSTWCVEQIPTEPSNFDTEATAWILPKPNWGSPC